MKYLRNKLHVSDRSDAKQSDIERSVAIKEHKQLSKTLDSCRWCIDSKYMLKHMIVAMDSEICLSLPYCTSLIDGHCILTPVQHITCQLQLDENVWEKLKVQCFSIFLTSKITFFSFYICLLFLDI